MQNQRYAISLRDLDYREDDIIEVLTGLSLAIEHTLNEIEKELENNGHTRRS